MKSISKVLIVLIGLVSLSNVSFALTPTTGQQAKPECNENATNQNRDLSSDDSGNGEQPKRKVKAEESK